MVRWEPKEERDEEDQEHLRKRKAEDVRLEYPCAACTERPRMIPINYPKEERDEEDQEHLRKRKAEDVRLEYPCAACTERPRMIPINYV
ncbi:hypothetical protein CCR75_008781 [Bremia lactucae]|uniref:Uncharacterized protein n=1 Tax=Bremia lactucae TaxID=4779 RepID=A0A976IAQ2_BRELC|nr:hypothetical protein CCR75_008781 [Bremia lactucae]